MADNPPQPRPASALGLDRWQNTWQVQSILPSLLGWTGKKEAVPHRKALAAEVRGSHPQHFLRAAETLPAA